MTIPTRVREEIRSRLKNIADEVNWAHLSLSAKSKYYEEWTRELEIGGVLARYMDKGKVRVYIKDTLLKDYTRNAMSDESRPLRVLGLGKQPEIAERYVKPHGLRLKDGRILSWSRADDWKLTLMALYERACAQPGSIAFGAVLLGSAGRFTDPEVCLMVERAAQRLGIEKVVWLS